jgi:hypothetical protein
MITNWNILSNNSRTLRYPPNINTWLLSRCWYPQVGRCFDTNMDVDYSYHAFTYIPQQHWYKYIPSCVCQRQNVFTIVPQLYKTLSYLEIPTEYQYLTDITIWYPQVGALIPVWMSIIHTMHSPTYHNNTGIKIYHHVYLNTKTFLRQYLNYTKDSPTLRCPPNINIWLASQFWYPQVGRCFDTIMDLVYSYHAFTFIPRATLVQYLYPIMRIPVSTYLWSAPVKSGLVLPIYVREAPAV